MVAFRDCIGSWLLGMSREILDGIGGDTNDAMIVLAIPGSSYIKGAKTLTYEFFVAFLYIWLVRKKYTYLSMQNRLYNYMHFQVISTFGPLAQW
jgi:hypothetical protein